MSQRTPGLREIIRPELTYRDWGKAFLAFIDVCDSELHNIGNAGKLDKRRLSIRETPNERIPLDTES